MNKQELKKLFDNENFIEGLRKVDSVESLQSFLAENNLTVSIEEINNTIKDNSELPEKDLNDITGGAKLYWFKVVASTAFTLKEPT